MKNLLIIFSVFSSLFVSAQCTVHLSDTHIETCPNTPFTISAYGMNSSSVLAACDFNSGLPLDWTVSGTSSFGDPCAQSLDATNYFWSDNTSGGFAYITTPELNLECGGDISFDLLMGVQGGQSPCDGPDQINEGVEVQYSIDGGNTWDMLAYFCPNGTILPVNPGGTNLAVQIGQMTSFTTWDNYSFEIPQGALSPSTQFRWTQTSGSGVLYDNWGIDNISISQFNCNDFTVNWSDGSIATPSITSATDVDTFFIANVYDTLGVLQCLDTCFVSIASSGFDNGVQLINGGFTAGQTTYATIDAYNLGCMSSSGDITMILDTALSFVSSSPSPVSVNGDTVVYSYASLYLNGNHHVVDLQLESSQYLQVGDSVEIDLWIEDIIGDVDTSNNVMNYIFPVAASYDPNDKKVYPTGECEPGYVLNDQKLTYTVRFQNTGTAPATNVSILDTLSSVLNPNSLKVIASSDDLSLDWLSSNVVEFKFNSIMLPTQASDEQGSIGYVIFEIEQNAGVVHGSPISNEVAIYFDFNPPIITNQVMNTVSDGSHHVIGDTITVEVDDEYFWEGETYTSGGIYGSSYALPNGCDSTVYLNLTILNEQSVYELFKGDVKMYPNPSNGKLFFEGVPSESPFRLLDNTGKVVFECLVDDGIEVVFPMLASGMYIAILEIEEKTLQGRLIVQ